MVEEPIYNASFSWPQRGAYTSTTWSLMPFSWSHLKNNDTHGLKQLLNIYILPLNPLLRYVDFLQSVPKWIFLLKSSCTLKRLKEKILPRRE